MKEIQISQQLSHLCRCECLQFINSKAVFLFEIFFLLLNNYIPTMLPILISFIAKQ